MLLFFLLSIKNNQTQRTAQNSSNQNRSVSPTAQSSVNNQNYVAAYDFQPQEEGEIELKRGDPIRMLDQSDSNWWKGEVRGNIGLFPATYVRPL